MGTDSSSNPLLQIHLVNASTIESKSDSPSSPLAISALVVNPVSTPGEVTLTAVNTDEAVNVDTEAVGGEVTLPRHKPRRHSRDRDRHLTGERHRRQRWVVHQRSDQSTADGRPFPILAAAVNSGVLQYPATYATAMISPLANSGYGSGGGGGGAGSGAGDSPNTPPPTYGVPTIVHLTDDAGVTGLLGGPLDIGAAPYANSNAFDLSDPSAIAGKDDTDVAHVVNGTAGSTSQSYLFAVRSSADNTMNAVSAWRRSPVLAYLGLLS